MRLLLRQLVETKAQTGRTHTQTHTDGQHTCLNSGGTVGQKRIRTD